MTRPSKIAVTVVLAGVLVAAAWYVTDRSRQPASTPTILARGGELVASYRTEPVSFNRHTNPNAADDLLSRLTHGRLIRRHRITNEIEPRLAERWTLADDGLTYTLALRRDVKFSDGQPFTSADVLFSFRAAYDEATNSPLGGELKVAGVPLEVTAPDEYTVVVRFPSPFGPGLRILDGLPILPRHKLEVALDEGRLREMWGTSTPPSELAGLGPFVLAEYAPGQRLVFARNPHYWGRDEAGVQLPYLDRLVMETVPEQNVEMLRLESGQLDITTDEARPEDVAAFRRAADAGRLQLVDVGLAIDPNLMWINLRPDLKASTSRRAWLQNEDFRKAISHAVDRDVFVNTVYLGTAEPVFGPVTPSHGIWFTPDLPRYPFDRVRARSLLSGLGLMDANRDGVLDDRSGAPVRFSLITQKGNNVRERSAAVIQDQLRQVGIAVDVVGLDAGALFQRFSAGDYDAIFFGVVITDPDPAQMSGFWLSSGAFHFWNPGQPAPATEWEARIDDLMRRHVTSLDLDERRGLFAEAQRILAGHVPVLYFAAPHVYVAMSPRVANATPAVTKPQVLWNAEVLAVKGGG